MYYVTDYNNVPLNVFVDQFSLIDDTTIGFLSAVGSRRALEDFRHRLATNGYSGNVRIHHCERDIVACYLYGSSAPRYRFFFRKLDNAPFWVVNVINNDVYSSCQDLVRGIRMSESQRKKDVSGNLWYNLPIYFLFTGADLFHSDEEMHTFMQANDAQKIRIIMHNPTFIDVLYQKLSSCSRLPFLREWMEPLLDLQDRSRNGTIVTLNQSGFRVQNETVARENKVFTFKVTFNEEALRSLISMAFQQHLISSGNNITSGNISNVHTLTQYLDQFGDNLVRKAHERFNPLYTPGVSQPSKKAMQFFSNTKYFSNLNYFAAQRDVICSVAKGLSRNKRTLIVGECGIGKTAIALASIYVHTQKDNPVSMVMCPGHMVEKWKAEIKRLYPFAKVHIIEKLDQLQKFESMIRNKEATSPLFLVFGKDSCKMEYDERPCMHWNSKTCHYETDKKKNIDIRVTYRSGVKSAERYTQQLMYFLKPNSKNRYIRWTGSYYLTAEHPEGTNSKVWTAASENNGEWVKVAKVGWVNTLLAQDLVTFVDQLAADGKEISKDVLKAYDIASAALNGNTAKPMIRCNISDYIRRRMKNRIDYFIADEVHLYSSKSTAQGKAFSNMVNASRHTIALTGTLLNGYAENIFSMLFKLYSRTFVRNGFSFNDSRDFAKEYGVVDTIREYRIVEGWNGSPYEQQEKSVTKMKPGISPLLFSKFLLDKAVFVTLADITSDLPNYHEIPVGVDMDYESARGYRTFFESFRTALHEHADEKDEFLLKTIKRLNMYPDQPYNQVPIFNNETGEQIMCPPSITRSTKVYASAKDKKLLELIQKHKANGEKVLVYVHWVKKLDCVDRIQAILSENGITSAFLTSSVTSREREKWIADKTKENIDVLICNPNLVKEGLDLLDFTTIIFYQMDDKLFTLRQASRRSMRLNQSHDVTVYILYFNDTVQENIICLMANKLQAAMAIEGKFSEEGLNAMGDTDSILTQLANNLTKDIDMKLEAGAFDFHTIEAETSGNRFKQTECNIMQNWFYKIDNIAKKKPRVISVDDDLLQLETGS